MGFLARFNHFLEHVIFFLKLLHTPHTFIITLTQNIVLSTSASCNRHSSTIDVIDEVIGVVPNWDIALWLKVVNLLTSLWVCLLLNVFINMTTIKVPETRQIAILPIVQIPLDDLAEHSPPFLRHSDVLTVVQPQSLKIKFLFIRSAHYRHPLFLSSWTPEGDF